MKLIIDTPQSGRRIMEGPQGAIREISKVLESVDEDSRVRLVVEPCGMVGGCPPGDPGPKGGPCTTMPIDTLLHMIHDTAKIWARELMDLDATDSVLIVSLLNVASQSKELLRRRNPLANFAHIIGGSPNSDSSHYVPHQPHTDSAT